MYLGIKPLVGGNKWREIIKDVDNPDSQTPGLVIAAVAKGEIILKVNRGVA